MKNNIQSISFTIKPDVDINVNPKKMLREAKIAIAKFIKDRKSGKLKPVSKARKNFL